MICGRGHGRPSLNSGGRSEVVKQRSRLTEVMSGYSSLHVQGVCVEQRAIESAVEVRTRMVVSAKRFAKCCFHAGGCVPMTVERETLITTDHVVCGHQRCPQSKYPSN